MAQAQQTRELIWAPQPGPQTALITCPAFEVFFGGARGGGKSDGVLGEWVAHSEAHGDKARGLVVRREATQLEDIIARSHQLYGRLGWDWNGTSKTWRSKRGAVLRFRHLWDEVAAQAYQGHSYTRFYPEEITNWPDPRPILMMHATLRSAEGVPVGQRATGNPGGPGHNWVKARYIDPAPPMHPIVDPESKHVRVFIPSKLEDNQALLQSDPEYAARLLTVGDEALVRAWLMGDWNIVAGGALDDVWVTERHVIEPFPIPNAWRLDRSFDWGSSKPFSVGWWAESDGESFKVGGVTRWYPKGHLIRFAELYGWNGKPNEGCRKLAVEVAREIVSAEKAMGIHGRVEAGPADSSIFAVENGNCIADDMARIGVRWTEADKSPGSRKNGLEIVRKKLKASLQWPQEEPGIHFFSTCRSVARTFPSLPRDPKKPDDVDTSAEDHAYDDTRYRCSAQQHSTGAVDLRM